MCNVRGLHYKSFFKAFYSLTLALKEGTHPVGTNENIQHVYHMQVFTPSKGAKVLILFLFFHILSICFKSSICVYDMKFYE